MNDTNDKDDSQTEVKQEKMEEVKQEKFTGKIYVKHEIFKSDPLENTNNDVQRAIKGLREIPDEELQEFLDDEDFMEGLDVVDTWERDEERNRENKQVKKNAVERKEKRSSRERHRPEPKGSSSRAKSKKEEKKREEIRRDPMKSTKDIERDKMRTKRDNESKLLAEKEKAIKHLLDSDNVVPPGTETEAIQSITEEQNRERAQREAQRNREHRRSKSLDRYSRSSPIRRRSSDRLRPSPHRRRSPFVVSPERRRSPLKMTAEKHRSPHRYSPSKRKNSPRHFSDRRTPVMLSPDRRRSPRRLSGERRSSVDKRWSPERSRRRRTERRRSRSHDRRSRSTERPRRRSRSRSPASRRYSPRRRSRTRTRSRSVEKRTRKRSPFINELARQLRNEAMMPTGVNSGGYVPPATMEGIAPLLNPPVYQQDPPESRPPPPSSVAPPTYMHQPGPPLAPSGPLPPPSMLPVPGPSFMNFELMPGGPPMNFEPPPPPPPSHILPPADYSSGPVMYNQPNVAPPPAQVPLPPSAIRPPLLPTPVPSPQPVPAPVMDHTQIPYNPPQTMPSIRRSPIRQFEFSSKPSSKPNHPSAPSTSSQKYAERGSTTSYSEFHVLHEERMKTPEPPVISKPKQFEKTSLSSLLEASVSAKDSSNIPVLYPGFKPEIMQLCEQALCQLPYEDPRLKMKGRFFYVREQEDHTKTDAEDHTSNSILLQKGKTKIFWEETNVEQQIPIPKSTTQMHQKICQTDEVEKETKGVQVQVAKVDAQTQIYPHELPQVKEEKRPILDRLNWPVRETYEYAPRFREEDDLRWSLNNSSQRRSYRQTSPSRRSTDEHEHHVDSMDHGSRSLRLESPVRSRDDFSAHDARDHYNHSRYSPDVYHRRTVEREDFHERRSDHSRGESPMELEESGDELMDDHTFQREHDWHGREKVLRGKSHTLRGHHNLSLEGSSTGHN